MQKLKLKDYLQTMAHNKIFDIEVMVDDMVYVGKKTLQKLMQLWNEIEKE